MKIIGTPRVFVLGIKAAQDAVDRLKWHIELAVQIIKPSTGSDK